MWFNPAELTNVPVCPPATSATLRLSEELSAIAAPKVAKSQESQAPRVLAPARDTPKAEPIADPEAEARRQRVLTMLAENPNIRRAVVVDNADADPVLVAVGIRDVATFELVIPAARFDAFKLLELIERHGTTLH